MIIPSIDLQGGSTVQLIGGEEKALDAGDPRPLLDRFSRVGETAVIDLDAAIGTPETADAGHNRALIEELCHRAPIRVGGGIRSEEAARRWLDAGAEKIILGTAAKPELL
ncbi:MAG: phosphoribosyl-ATP pyrophosphohydrolase/phosphoribosyl-AMP cyclohydrolase, partial [Planctomycetota bacterium]